MASIRSTIIALAMLGAGIFAIQRIGEAILKQPGLPTEAGQFGNIISGMRSMTDLMLIAVGTLIVMLMIYAAIRKAASRKPAAAPAAMPAEAAAKMEENIKEAPAEEREETEERMDEKEPGEGGTEEEK
ncbi:MAG: hypothetical protein QW548_01995 [Candidatus Aenigmatarchaeota archaeon]